MSDSSPLPTLIELARQRVDDAARALGEAVRNADAARAKLALLARYRDDYARRFQAGLERGLSTMYYTNFRSFLDKLESAARGQEDAVRDAEGYVEVRRSAWEAATRKRDSFLTLLDRATIEKKRVEDKREQRLTVNMPCDLVVPDGAPLSTKDWLIHECTTHIAVYDSRATSSKQATGLW